MAPSVTRILVPTDFSETADAALAYAKALAVRLGASLHLVHVFANPSTLTGYAPDIYAPHQADLRERALREVDHDLRKRLGSNEEKQLRGTIAILSGLTAKEIVRYAADHAIDLIVIGTHGRRGVAHLLLGSVAEHVVRTALCPVLTVRGAATPVEQQAAAADGSRSVA